MIAVAVVAVAAFAGVPTVSSLAQGFVQPTASVRDYGAAGDGFTNDTTAIQRANNAVAASGGGTVFFPAGVYIAAGVRQDSNVEFSGAGNATLKHPDGVSGRNIVESRVWAKKGWIVEGSSLLWMSDTTGVVPGAIVGVLGAGGASPVQTSTLSVPLTAVDPRLSVAQGNGWALGPNYLLIDDEIVSYSAREYRTFTNLKRGVFGTGAGPHGKGARVSQLRALYARVVSVGNGWAQLDGVAVQGVQATNVFVGSINMTVRGLSLDGSKVPGGSTSNPFPLKYKLARWVTIEGNTIRNGDHGAISLDQGTSESSVTNNVLVDNGMPSARLGSAIWLYRGASDNVVGNNEIYGDSQDGVMVDDRSESATEWDAPANRNLILGNRIDIPPAPRSTGIWAVGSEDNVIEGNEIRSSERGISVTVSTQGTNPASARSTVVRSNVLTGHATGLWVTGSNNWFERNQIAATNRPIFARGSGNQYIENWVT